MKLVINKCFGGFSLSHEAVMLYAKLKGIELYGFTEGRKANGEMDFHKFVPYVEGDKPLFCIYYSTKPLKDGKIEDDSYFSYRDIERSDENLVKVVEQLGEKANGMCAKLQIIEIPDGVDYEIDDYDGSEHIAEKHRTWE